MHENGVQTFVLYCTAHTHTHTVPYGLRAAYDALHDVIPDLLPVIFVDVKRKDDFAQ